MSVFVTVCKSGLVVVLKQMDADLLLNRFLDHYFVPDDHALAIKFRCFYFVSF